MLLPTNGCWKPNYIPFPLCLWSNEQANHAQEVWQYVSRGALGREHASQFSTNQSIVAEFRRLCVLKQRKGQFAKKVCFQRSRKFKVKKKGLIGLEDFYQDLPRQPIIVAKFHLILRCPP